MLGLGETPFGQNFLYNMMRDVESAARKTRRRVLQWVIDIVAVATQGRNQPVCVDVIVGATLYSACKITIDNKRSWVNVVLWCSMEDVEEVLLLSTMNSRYSNSSRHGAAPRCHTRRPPDAWNGVITRREHHGFVDYCNLSAA